MTIRRGGRGGGAPSLCLSPGGGEMGMCGVSLGGGEMGMCGVSLGGGEVEMGELVGVEGRVVVLGRGLFSDILGCGENPLSVSLPRRGRDRIL